MEEHNYWTHIFRKRVSRRAVLGAGAAAALGSAGLALAGCREGGPGPAATVTPGAEGTPAALEPKYGGTLISGRSVEVTGLDPHTDLSGLDIDAQLYSYLYSFLNEEMIFNNLAESCECADPEHLEFIFHLRPGVQYHPIEPVAGLEVTAEDVLASFQRRSTAITAIDKRFPNVIDFDQTETPDALTFKLVTKRPFVPAIQEMANPTWAIVAKAALEEFPHLGDKEFGSGPFMLESFSGAERIRVVKHPQFFVAGRPFLDAREWRIIRDNTSLLAVFRAKQHDINGAVLDKIAAEELQRQYPDMVINKSPGLFYPVIHLSLSKRDSPFRDPRVRKAIDLAIDRQAIIDKISLGEGKINGPIQWGQEKWALPQQELQEFYRADPEEARRLLQEAGYDRLRLTVKMPLLPGPQIVTDLSILLKEQLDRAGIDFTTDPIELGAFLTTALLPGAFDVAFFIQLPYGEPDRPLSFYHSQGVTGSRNWTGLDRRQNDFVQAGFSPEVDDLIEAQQQEFDVETRRQIILDVQRKILKEHGPQISLVSGYAYSAHWNYVHFGTGEELDREAPFGSNIWLDKA